MAKKKKTRQQKIIADLRRQLLLKKSLSSQKTQVATLDIASKTAPKKEPLREVIVEKKETDTSYNYLISDLKRTAILTSSIVALQIILFLALENKLFILPGLSY